MQGRTISLPVRISLCCRPLDGRLPMGNGRSEQIIVDEIGFACAQLRCPLVSISWIVQKKGYATFS